jgi:hypothetical protein
MSIVKASTEGSEYLSGLCCCSTGIGKALDVSAQVANLRMRARDAKKKQIPHRYSRNPIFISV